MGQKDSRAHEKSGREIEREDYSKDEGDAEREIAGDRRCLKIASDFQVFTEYNVTHTYR